MTWVRVQVNKVTECVREMFDVINDEQKLRSSPPILYHFLFHLVALGVQFSKDAANVKLSTIVSSKVSIGNKKSSSFLLV